MSYRVKRHLSAPSLPTTIVVILCTAEFDVLALFVFVRVYTGTGTVKASPGEALKDHQCLCMFLSRTFFIVCHVFLFLVFILPLFSSPLALV